MLTYRYVRGFVVVGSLVSATSSYATDIPLTRRVAESKTLTISNALGYPPLQFADDQGKPSGMNIELADAVASALGAKLEVIVVPFASQLPTLAAARVDAAWATFTVTEERLKQVDFVTFLSAPTVFTTTSSAVSNFGTKESLCGTPIAVAVGTTADFAADKLSAECIASGKKEIQKQIFPDQQSVIQSVISGRTIGFLDDATASAFFASGSKGKFIVAPGAYFPAPLGVAVSKGDAESARMIQAAFAEIIKNGEYRRILTKYNLEMSAISEPQIYTDSAQLPK